MKTLKFLLGAILVLGLQQRLPAPPATPVPTYYEFEPLIPDLLPPPVITVEETNNGGTYSGEITDWSIPTPDGTLTPGNSTLADIDFMLSPTLIPLDDLNFTGPGGSYSIDVGPSGGSLNYPGGSIAGAWSVPDDSNAVLTLSLAAAAILGCNAVSRKNRKA
jgi:hypothetical protein